MLNTYILLFIEFFKTGLFTFGGGFGSLPFLYAMAENYPWFTISDLTRLIAISGITPGPIGLNMATFAGYKTAGILGSFIASLALVLPMIIITSRIFKLYDKFEDNCYVQSVLKVLRPTACALLFYVGTKLFYNLVLKNDVTFKSFDVAAFSLLILLFALTFKLKRDPIIYMAIAGVFGIIYFMF